MTMGDRVAVLKGGVLQQVDTPKRLYESPVNAFVAGFIGSPSMNLFEATMTGGELMSSAFAIRLQDAAFVRRPGLKSYAGRKIVFGIRPEDLYDSSLESGRKYQTIPAKVTSIEELGSEHIVHLNIDAIRVDSGDPDAVQDFGLTSNAVARFEPDSTVHSGSAIRLALDDTKLHFFDPETHLAI
jgi:multiple sugar transport system ATP-binding protein